MSLYFIPAGNNSNFENNILNQNTLIVSIGSLKSHFWGLHYYKNHTAGIKNANGNLIRDAEGNIIKETTIVKNTTHERLYNKIQICDYIIIGSKTKNYIMCKVIGKLFDSNHRLFQNENDTTEQVYKYVFVLEPNHDNIITHKVIQQFLNKPETQPVHKASLDITKNNNKTHNDFIQYQETEIINELIRLIQNVNIHLQ